MLAVRDLTIRYMTRPSPAVRAVSFSLDPREFVLLAGASASGKSTLMQAICGFLPHIIPAEVSGRVDIDGETDADPTRISQAVAMVQQDPEAQFCTETVEEEIAFGPENFCLPRDEIFRRIDEALASVNAAALRHRKLSTLSGGEKQKVAIAAMLTVQPQVLILDEPTANLDPVSVAEVLEAVAALRCRDPDLTLVVVEHRIHRFEPLATRLMVMEDGELVADAPRGSGRYEHYATDLMRPPAYPRFERPRTRSGTAEGSGASHSAAAIAVDALSYTIDDATILDEISFTLPYRAVAALMGRNGAGKTTLLRHLAGLEQIQHGSVHIGTRTLSPRNRVPAYEIGAELGLVFQNPNHQLFEHTIEKECLFGPQNFGTDLDDARAELERFCAREDVAKGLHPHALSFGQKRRLNITAASVHRPRFLLLDEPFAGQDRWNAAAIARLIRRYQRRGCTTIVVSHDPTFVAAACTHCVILHEGRVVDTGPPRRVLAKDTVQGLLLPENDPARGPPTE